MRAMFLKLGLVVVLTQTSQAQDVDPAFLFRQMMQLVAQNDSCVLTNKVSFQQSYRWTIVPVSIEHAGIREITVENGITQVRVFSKSERELPGGSEKLFKRMAELRIMNFLPARIESTQCSFSPIGPTVMMNGEVFHILECHDRNPEFRAAYERTIWIRAATMEPARIELLISGIEDITPYATRIAVEIARPNGFSCLVPLLIEQNDLKKTEIATVTIGRLQIVNSNFRP